MDHEKLEFGSLFSPYGLNSDGYSCKGTLMKAVKKKTDNVLHTLEVNL